MASKVAQKRKALAIRSSVIAARFTPGERSLVERAAAAAKLNLSLWVSQVAVAAAPASIRHAR